MAKVEITKTTYACYGNCVRITNGIIELYITTDFGPRIIHFSRVGKENMMYNDTDIKPLGEQFDCYEGDICKLYGGHRIWTAPEIMPRCYHPDNGSVVCDEIENGMTFAAEVEKHNQIQKIMTIELTEDDETVKITHTIINVGAWEIELAPWCITMLAAGGIEVFPQNTSKTGLLHNQNLSLWDYSNMNDERIYWGKEFMMLRQDANISQPFKVGYNNESGWGAYFNRGQLFIKYFEPSEGGLYPDNNCSYETYTNNVMLEAETLGEMVILEPKKKVVHIEEWELYEETAIPTENETEIKKILSKYLSL